MSVGIPRARSYGAALALVGGLLLSGCTSDQLGAAAVVGGRGVPVSELQTSVRELRAIDPATDTRVAQQRVLESLIASRVLAKLAAQRQVTVTDGQVDQFIGQAATQSGGVDGLRRAVASAQNGYISPSQLRPRARDILLRAALARALVPGDDNDQQVGARRTAEVTRVLAAEAGNLGIAVNPRYGAWDPAKSVIAPVVSGGLAKPESGGADPADPSTG